MDMDLMLLLYVLDYPKKKGKKNKIQPVCLLSNNTKFTILQSIYKIFSGFNLMQRLTLCFSIIEEFGNP